MQNSSKRGRSGARRTVLALTAALALSLGPTQTSQADPATQLPDADLFCGAGYATKVASWSALIAAASQWIDDPVFGGHYVLLADSHYRAEGLLFAPVTDLTRLTFLRAKDYGRRAGLDAEVISCQIVSRFRDPDRTIIAPVTMARVND